MGSDFKITTDNNMRYLTLISLLVLIAFSCKKNDDNEIVQINYGISFGECIGYCKHDIHLESGIIRYTNSGWSDTIETTTCTDFLAKESWDSYTSAIDIKSFFKLPETIGCPDCTDGGAEFIEIITSGEKHKVTFEYFNEPETLREIIVGLRGQIEQGENCGNLN